WTGTLSRVTCKRSEERRTAFWKRDKYSSCPAETRERLSCASPSRTSNDIANQARRCRAHLRVRHSIDASIEQVVNESCCESQSNESRHPGRRSELCCKRTKYSIAVVRSRLAICFHLENREEHERQQHEQKHEGPWPLIQSVQIPANDPSRGSRLRRRSL